MFVQEYTLPNLPLDKEEYTMHEAFNRAYLGIIKQGCQSHNFYSKCVYRGQEETRCALGFLISDQEYKSKWDAGRFLPQTLRRLIPSWKNLPVKFLSDLQFIHDKYRADSGFFVTYYREAMASYAQANGLSVPKT